MKFRDSILAVPVVLAAALALTNCSDDNQRANGNTGGAPGGSGGSSTGGAPLGTGGLGTGGASAGSGGVSGGGSAGFSGGGSSGASGGGTGGLGTGGASAGSGGVSGGGSSGASGGGAGGGVPATFETVKNVIAMSCSMGTPCHTEPGNPLQMAVNDQLYATLTSHMTEHCGPLIKKGSPQESAFVRLMKGPCGGTDRMPYIVCSSDEDEACIAPNVIAAIEQWIASGAPM